MLGNARGVHSADDDFQPSFQIAGFGFQIPAFISFGIGLRRVHIAFAVHHFVIFPVDDRTSSHAYLEEVRVSQHQVGGHIAAETPAVYAYLSGIHIRK